MCGFSLLHEALSHVEHDTAIGLAFAGFGVHHALHVIGGHTHSHDASTHHRHCHQPTMQHHHGSIRFNRHHRITQCEPCHLAQTTDDSPAANPSSCRNRCHKNYKAILTLIAFGLHSVMDGVFMGLALHVDVGISLVLAFAICIVQDTILLGQRIFKSYESHRRRLALTSLLTGAIMLTTLTIGITIGATSSPDPEHLSAIIAVSIGMLIHEALEGLQHTEESWKKNIAATAAILVSYGVSELENFLSTAHT